MLYQLQSTCSVEEIERNLQNSAVRHQFGVIATLDLRQTMKKKNVDLPMECRVYEVCNPQQAKKLLEIDAAFSALLPCRISLYGSSGKYTLAAMLPTEMMKAFNRPEIGPIADEVETVLVEMMQDAAGRK